MSTKASDFKDASRVITRNMQHRFFIQKALKSYETVRDLNKSRFVSWADARQSAAEIKWEAINHLDQYLAEFADKIEANGAKVHWASTGDEACEIILQIAKEKGAKSIIKSKTMTSEEIHLNHALEEAGYSVVESDLGEYIVQLRHEPPYHLVFPAMHLTRQEISDLFEKELGSAKTDDPAELTMIARRAMRSKYLTADIGISGTNFAVAETGMISITENEGNARLTTSVPKVHIALLGIEKVLPKLDDLALFLPMLATAGAGQAITCYNSMISGPRRPGEPDGPEELHIVLLDNRRTQILADPEQRDSLHCIRCGACLNVCPIFRNVGGHSYGTTYQGPIGSVITPNLKNLQDWKHLSSSSSLCGACTEACPVKIDLHHHLLQNRRNAVAQKPIWWEWITFRLAAFFMNRPALFRLGAKLASILQPLQAPIQGTALDPARAWTQTREAPKVATRSFADYWKERAK